MNLLDRAKGFGGNLLDFAHAYATKQYDPIGQSDLEAMAGSQQTEEARRVYDQQYRAARAKAIDEGAAWYNMGDIAGAVAQQGYTNQLTNAANAAETLRQRREREARDKGIRERVAQMTGLSDEQRGFLGVASPDAAEQVLAKHLFPTSAQGGRAAAGSIVSTYRRPDGRKVAIVQTGDPENPVKEVEMGYEDASTSEMRTMQAYDTDAAMARGIRQREFARMYGTEAAKVQTKAEAEIPMVMQQAHQGIQRLTALRAKLAALPTGPIEGKAKLLYQAEMQAINAELNNNALKKIADLQNEGVRLTPITEHELKILFSVSPSVENLPAANVAILDRQIAELQRTLQTSMDYMRYIDSGAPILSYRPSWYDIGQAPGQGGGEPPPAPRGQGLQDAANTMPQLEDPRS